MDKNRIRVGDVVKMVAGYSAKYGQTGVVVGFPGRFNGQILARKFDQDATRSVLVYFPNSEPHLWSSFVTDIERSNATKLVYRVGQNKLDVVKK